MIIFYIVQLHFWQVFGVSRQNNRVIERRVFTTMTEKDLEKCTCNDDKMKVPVEKECPVCQSKFVGEEQLECPLAAHSSKVFICGIPLQTCDDCLENKFVYVSGHGGAPHILDHKLQKTFYKLTKYEEDDICHLNNGYTHFCNETRQPTTLQEILNRTKPQ